MTAHALNLSYFVRHYRETQNKEEEAVAILEAFQQIREDTSAEIELSEKKLVEKLHNFATKADLKELEARLELKIFRMVSEAKWQVIGVMLATFVAAIVIPLFLKHFGL